MDDRMPFITTNDQRFFLGFSKLGFSKLGFFYKKFFSFFQIHACNDDDERRRRLMFYIFCVCLVMMICLRTNKCQIEEQVFKVGRITTAAPPLYLLAASAAKASCPTPYIRNP